MLKSRSECQDELIDQFLSGKISANGQSELERHLMYCDRCETKLTLQTAEPEFWQDVKIFLSDQHFSHSSIVSSDRGDLDHLLSLVLGPTDDPTKLGRFGGYEVCGVIGRGGMGIVLKGLDISLDRFVAIKLLDPSFAGGSSARQRFVREAQAAAAVVNDNVIAIYSVDHSGRYPFLVMPYIKGESLQQRIDRAAPLSLEDMLSIAMQIARGLSAAHDQGLVHRDIKPANILMPANVSRVIITDFGLARAADDASLTRSGVIAGTPQYMAPEQVTGEVVDGKADLFSLGSVMYAMACGHPPFRADTPYGVMRRITDHPHRPLSQVRSETPGWFAQIVDRLLQKEPSMRFSSAKELASYLEDCLAHIRQPTTVMLPRLELKRRPRRWRRFWIVPVLAISIIVIVLTVDFRGEFGDANQHDPVAKDWADIDRYAPAMDDSDLLQLETDLDQLWRDVDGEPK